MALVPPGSRFPAVAGPSAAQDPLQAALGLQAWVGPPTITDSNIALVSQTLYGILVPTTAGVVYNGVKLNVAVVGTSTAPTGFFVGLASAAVVGAASTMLAQSSNLNGSAALTAAIGIQAFAFNATYTETVTGLRTILVLQNGAFGGTNVTFARKSAINSIGTTGAVNIFTTSGTAVTAFAANGSPVAAIVTNNSVIGAWAALY